MNEKTMIRVVFPLVVGFIYFLTTALMCRKWGRLKALASGTRTALTVCFIMSSLVPAVTLYILGVMYSSISGLLYTPGGPLNHGFAFVMFYYGHSALGAGPILTMMVPFAMLLSWTITLVRKSRLLFVSAQVLTFGFTCLPPVFLSLEVIPYKGE